MNKHKQIQTQYFIKLICISKSSIKEKFNNIHSLFDHFHDVIKIER